MTLTTPLAIPSGEDYMGKTINIVVQVVKYIFIGNVDNKIL